MATRLIPLSERLTPDVRTFLWGLFVAFSAKVVTMVGSPSVMILWQAIVLVGLSLILPMRFLAASIVACIVFLDASLWFQQGVLGVNTVYESAGAEIKPPELLLAVLALRLLPVLRREPPLPSWMKVLGTLWIAVIVMGAFTAYFGGTPIRTILIYSELRSPIMMIIALILIAPLVRARPQFFVDTFGTFLLVHFAISLLSWATGVSLLWASYARAYVGGQTAFFGADESVMVYLLVQAIALAVVVGGRPEVLTDLPRWVWIVVLAAATLGIIASLRRGGVLTSAIVGVFVFAFSNVHQKTRIIAVLAVFAPALVLLAYRSGIVTGVTTRLSGEGSAALADAGRAQDRIQAFDHVMDHFWFGTGPGTRLELARTKAYGVYESLSIHHSLLHIWVRFGIIAVVLFVALFVLPVLSSLGALVRSSEDQEIRTFRILIVSQIGLLTGLLLWGLSTPVIFTNFRQAAVWVFAVAFLFAAQDRLGARTGAERRARHIWRPLPKPDWA